MISKKPEGGENKPHVLLITRAPGIGKTTVMRRTANALRHKGLRGFYTEGIREDGCRFRLVSLDGAARVIADVDFPKRHRVGKYGVDVLLLNDAARLLRLDPDARVYLVAEIG